MALTERTVLLSIKVEASGRIEVERADQVLRDGELIASTSRVQVLEPDADLTQAGIEPQVLAAAAAWWTPQQQAQGVAAMLDRMRQAQEQAASRLQATQELLAREEAALAGAKRTRAAVLAAHAELDAEHASLAQRSAEIAAERNGLFAQRAINRKALQ